MPRAERQCSQCSSKFRPSSGHAKCPACRSRDRRVPCPRCGVREVDPTASSCRDCLVQRGALNPRWAGGRTKHSAGYVLVYAPDHPSRTGKATPYVMEHRLVMEHHLGRELLPSETVHHKNGVKSDNRLENLELWVTSQPAGQRPEDLVLWAKHVLSLYGD